MAPKKSDSNIRGRVQMIVAVVSLALVLVVVMAAFRGHSTVYALYRPDARTPPLTSFVLRTPLLLQVLVIMSPYVIGHYLAKKTGVASRAAIISSVAFFLFIATLIFFMVSLTFPWLRRYFS